MGLHEATLDDIRLHLGFTPRREMLIEGLRQYLDEWTKYGLLDFVVIDGSFVTAKPEPSDIDMLLVPMPASLYRTEMLEAFERLAADRLLVKHTFGCHVIVVLPGDTPSFGEWLDFFGRDKNEGTERGLLSLSMKQ